MQDQLKGVEGVDWQTNLPLQSVAASFYLVFTTNHRETRHKGFYDFFLCLILQPTEENQKRAGKRGEKPLQTNRTTRWVTGRVIRCGRSCWQHRHRHKYTKSMERSAVWPAISSLITRAVLEEHFLLLRFLLSSSPSTALRWTRATSMYTLTFTTIIQVFLLPVPSWCGIRLSIHLS